MSNAAHTKVCILCGQDCSARPRTRDAQGRYACEDCLKARRGAASAAQPADDGPIALAEEPASVQSGPRDEGGCPNCAQILPADAHICIRCGFNRVTNQMVRTSMDQIAGSPSGLKKRACTKCSYDMTGLKTARCPECGTVNVRPTREQLAKRSAKQQRLWMWLGPVIMIAAGFGIMAAWHFSQRGVAGVVAYSILFAASLFVGLIVYLIASMMWIGFDEPLPITALRLAGVYALADIGFSIVGSVPALGMLGIGFWAIPGLIYVGLLVKVMDIDMQDAVIVATLTTITKIALVITAAALLG